jgi:periplasmic glucans biosynthesis protein
LARQWIAGALLAGVCLCAHGAEPSLFDQIINKARTLAGQPYQGGEPDLPEALDALDYPGYRDIRFRKEQALWGDSPGYSVEFFHPGFLYRHPVTIHEVVGGEVRTLPFDTRMFHYGNHGALNLPRDLGFAGFRLHFPIHDPSYKDELIAFLGASYFRMVGRGQHYGLSARGLAVDTAVPSGEEFPRFTEFWLVRPEPRANQVEFYAMLDSESVTGAYAFVLESAVDTLLHVRSRLFARSDVQKLGVAPLTSMFTWGENKVRPVDDYRPEVHDSDGLIHNTGAGEWIWRPLVNPPSLQVSALLDTRLAGFGLAQRDRSFDSYQDPESQYHRRPGIWITPGAGDWGKGSVQLVEIPSANETNDNIVAFWVNDQPLRAGESVSFDYTLRTFGRMLNPENLAQVIASRNGWGWIPGASERPPPSLRQFVVDFEGGELTGLSGAQPVKAELAVDRGAARNLTVARLPVGDVWRVAFKLTPAEVEQKVNMRMFLTLRGRRVSETWNYLWDPATVPPS